MSKEENKFIEAAKEEHKFIEAAKEEEDSASASEERYNDIEEEYQNELKRLAAIWKQQQREEMEADIDKLIAKKKIPWETRTPKIIKKRETRKIWYSRQLTDKQLKRLESLKSQQRSKTIQLKQMHVMLNSCKSLCTWSMPLSWSKQDMRNMFSCFGEVSKCQITDPTRKVVRPQKRAHYVKKKRHLLFYMTTSTATSCLPISDTPVMFPLLCLSWTASPSSHFTSSKFVRTAMHFDSSTIVQTFYQGSILLGKDGLFFLFFFKKKGLHTCTYITVNFFFLIEIFSEYEHSSSKNLAKMEQQVDKFMFEFDRLTALQHKQYKENTPHHMRDWIQAKGKDGFNTIYYSSKFLRKKYRKLADTYNDQPVSNIYDKKKLKEYYQLNNVKDFFAIKKSRVIRQKNKLKGAEIAKFDQGKWTKATSENMRHRGRDQFRPKKTSLQPSSQSSLPLHSATSNKLHQKLNIRSKTFLCFEKREMLNLLNPFRFCVDFFVCLLFWN
ncbi:hypothetical protein RFI_31873 [Reticulomyxa filosa]|uniref:Uncharacterized protein n=1 Tax=Reticulomyxa filosa TaxID=46433 RepID=X6LUC7_RETFI|nr:hypothetical protein RFI_31873 [Reticulomyxa filosa]|eukprot:ETO05523.1 hypothetical protein RFI_31873 [Reticulomyxa filosa]